MANFSMGDEIITPMESDGPSWHQDICDPPFASWNLTYDTGANTVGNLTRVTEQDGSIVNYGYDALYRLTSEARTGVGPYSVTYGYDLANNVTTRNGTAFGVYNTANTMTSVSGVALDKDADGNQEEVKGNGIPFNIDPILFDSRNKVRSAVYNGATYRFLTDAAGRRTKRCTTSNCNVQGTGDRYYIFSGDKVIGEVVNGVPEVAYTWGADGIASRKLLTGLQNSRYYCFGPQGETRYLTDEFQTVSSTYRYEAYGKTLNATGSDYNPFRYGGKFGYYSDQNLPLMLAGARWHSPHLLRWLSFDPISYEGGDNLYAYVMGNPVKYVDLDGLQAVPLPATPLPPPGMVGPGTVGPSLGQVGDDLTKKAQELFDRLTDPRIPYWMQPFFQEDSDPTSPPVLPPPVCKDPVVGKSGKERASDVPSWAEGFRPYLGESGKEFAKRLLDGKYGPGKHRKGPGSEFDKIRKWGDRGFK